MRYFSVLPGPEAGLTMSVAEAALITLTVATLRALPRLPARDRRATGGTISLTAIARPADHHLTMAAGTIE
ncbi:MAG: hypothetical protein O2868_00535 [Proteobacteria bacterium]|nr:hypothetical protein [Pseudomonadota bacterium]